MSPLATLVGLLWASTTLWPPSALVLLLAARTHVLLVGLPHPRAEHQEVIPDVQTLRVLLGVARPELQAHPDLATALERLVGECEEVSWYSPPILDSRALLAQWREAAAGRVLDQEASLWPARRSIWRLPSPPRRPSLSQREGPTTPPTPG